METTREQTRQFEVQDRSPSQGQPVGPSQEPDQQARIRSRPAWPRPPEADRLSPAVDGEAAAQGLLRLRLGAPTPPLLSRGGARPQAGRRAVSGADGAVAGGRVLQPLTDKSPDFDENPPLCGGFFASKTGRTAGLLLCRQDWPVYNPGWGRGSGSQRCVRSGG